MAAACLSLLVIFLDNTIVNVAIPAIQHGLSSAPDALEWAINAYVVAFAGLVVVGGKLGDRWGRRRMFVIGLVLFAAASVAGAVAGTTGLLIGARAVQGTGAALLAPLSLSLLAEAFPATQLPVAIGVWAGVSGVGLAIGPLAGGLLIEHSSWHAVFWVNVPIAVAAALFALPGLRGERPQASRRVDWVGAALITAALTGVVAGLTRAILHPWTSGWTLGLLGAGTAAGVLCVVQQASTREGLLPLVALRRRGAVVGMAVLALGTLPMFGTLWFLTLYLQNVRGYSAIAAGVRTLPLTLATLLIAPLAGKVATRRGPRGVLLTGLVLAACALTALTRLTAHTGYPAFAAALVGLGAGFALSMPTAASLVLDRVPRDQVGVIAGVATMARQLGGALGLALLAALGENVAYRRFATLSGLDHRYDALVAGGQTAEVTHLAGRAAGDAATRAFIDGFAATAAIGAAAIGVTFVLTALLLSRHRPDGEPTTPRTDHR
jgi:EmrB/QacA subfamily drug resistance transporter